MDIPGYKIIKKLGHGGMATVYLAMHEMLERKVAIKVMAPSLAADPTFGERFLREAKIVARLSHPNIIAVYDVGISGTNHYIAMEYQSGGELKDKIGTGMDPAEAIEIIKQVASALNFAHGKGYIHRDVKPENILFSEEGKALLTDFGIARAEDSATRMTKTGSVIGTPTYMSPEQAQGIPLDGRADLYSLGVVFYEMLTGSPPYTGDSGVSIAVKHMTEPVPTLKQGLKKYQPFLDKVMAKNPDDRVQSGQEFIALLDQVERGELSRQDGDQTQVWIPEEDKRTQVVDVQQQQGGKRSTGLVAAVSAVIIVAAGIAAYLVMRDEGVDTPQVADRTTPEITQSPSDDDPLQQKIATLLTQADIAVNEDRLISPSNDNAYQKYQAIYLLDGDNKAAQQGLLTISNIYLDRAQASINEKKLEKAEGQIGQARQIFEQNPAIKAMNERLTLARQAQQKEIQAEKDSERKAREQARLAEERLQAVERRKLEEQRAAAEAEKLRLAEEKRRQEQQAARLAEEKRLQAQRVEEDRRKEAARRAAELEKQRQAEEKKRKQEETLRLARLQQQKEEEARKEQERLRKEREAKIADIVSRVNDYLSADKLSLTRINRARKLYQDLRSVDADNAELKKADSRLARSYAALANRFIDDKEFDRAEETILQGLEMAPGNDDLLVAQETLKERQKKKRRTFGGF